MVVVPWEVGSAAGGAGGGLEYCRAVDFQAGQQRGAVAGGRADDPRVPPPRAAPQDGQLLALSVEDPVFLHPEGEVLVALVLVIALGGVLRDDLDDDLGNP